MNDIEKVIKGVFEMLQRNTWKDIDLERYRFQPVLNDALALLKKQEAVEPKTGHWIVLEYCANEGIYCSECHMKIFDRLTKPKKNLSQYCPHCGSRNEQFFRNGEVVFR
jgi:Zn finger protein HypA/HybF involved in hydrogenase expression